MQQRNAAPKKHDAFTETPQKQKHTNPKTTAKGKCCIQTPKQLQERDAASSRKVGRPLGWADHRHYRRRCLIDLRLLLEPLAAILEGSHIRPKWVYYTEKGVLCPTIMSKTQRIFTRFSHGQVCYKRQRCTYNTWRCHTSKYILLN